MMNYQHDIFISHASEDKDEFVRPLAQKLRDKGYRVWYDEFSLTVGDSLSSSIDKGLKESRFGIIVISSDFIKKSWTQRELQGLVQKELQSGKTILPIWHKVSYQQVLDFSPTLADKLAANTSKGIPQVVNEIVAALSKAGVVISQPQENTFLKEFEFETVKFQSGTKKFTRTSQARYFLEDLGFGVKLEMVEIPGGTFLMGAFESEAESRDNERPTHHVTVPTFFMGKYAVTQEQWARVVASCPKINRDLDPTPSRFKGDDHLPVERVSWYEAVEFCHRLSQKTGRNYRLPSEAEWEYACRAGTTTPFHFGETITTEVANYDGNYIYGAAPKGKYRKQTTSVGSFPPNYLGLYDMHGNVWEWCLDDWHANYEAAPTDGSPWFNDNDNIFQKSGNAVLRGGSWIYYPRYCRSAFRFNYVRAGRVNFDDPFGYRVVCAAGRIFR
ncbi:SUMF1/EgtB/PvdO family nonheme iron enzyme [Nostoc sp. FACHB-152]|uniref:SUMF1/EgtB/PvdO family nonheme iron enzyme n=1 Tax=unclassified Nostoc TaxID=2593658 RepID=UPI0016840156|nr:MULTISPECIES: SUMF1/EgtB/PvdO family nonheme iron enzyme [unclassified Nostoc]MBD2449557.1 SUMF1/EgtB/PvdO family nonheme iron enzyme [Nostoc sp. FACHB-152]MBD2470894.1 SUMF1/EgtB/PvdO family nonheme iron enzyme [Nostoc sp. FACHB-145]